MNILDKGKLTVFTALDAKLCLSILETVEREFGEIGNFLIEDSCVSFCVYGGYFENAHKVIFHEDYSLKLVGRFDHDYTLSYYILPKNGKH